MPPGAEVLGLEVALQVVGILRGSDQAILTTGGYRGSLLAISVGVVGDNAQVVGEGLLVGELGAPRRDPWH